MILDAAGTFSDNQQLVAVAAGNHQSTNWIDFGEFVDKQGVTSHRDVGAGEPFGVHFHVDTAFSNSLADPAAIFQAFLYIDDTDPPDSASGNAIYLPGSHQVLNAAGIGFAFSLGQGNSFVLPLTSPQGGVLDPSWPAASRSLGRRYMRIVYVFSGTGTFTGAITAKLTTMSHAVGRPNSISKQTPGMYPANVDWGMN